jgi:hypothetical protein
MALDKLIAPGTTVRVKSLKWNTAGLFPDPKLTMLPALRLWQSPGHTLVATATVGDILQVLKKPRKVYGINLCRVSDANGIEGEIYWTEMRSNCEVV